MNFNFELILFYATLITGVIYLFDAIFLMPKRKRRPDYKADAKLPIIVDYARSFFPVLLIVFLLRSFLYEPFRIPSSSLEPSLLTGDFILLNKFDYGIHLPVLKTKVLNIGEPKRGDVMVFHWPPNPSYYFIKRVIGLPGDHIDYVNKELTINGQKIPQKTLDKEIATDENGVSFEAIRKEEDLLGVKHPIYIQPDKAKYDFHNIVVPEGMYFVMGDNRDGSADSRYWGFVSEKNVVGKAVLVWMSWDKIKDRIRFDRIGKVVH